jgi:hypothetical protein
MLEYENNLEAALAGDGATVTRGREGGIESVRTALGAGIAWRPPAGSTPAMPEVNLGAAAIRIAANAARDVARIDADARLSETAKRDDTAAVSRRAFTALAELEQKVEANAREHASLRAQVLGVPPLAAGDTAEAIVDGECRAWVRGLSREEQARLGVELANGEHTRLLQALVRSAMPLPPYMKDLLPAAVRAAQYKANPERVEGIEARAERVEWLGEVVRQAYAATPAARAGGAK